MTESVDTISWIAETARAVDLARNAGEAQKQADVLNDAAAELGRVLLQLRTLQRSATVARELGWGGMGANPELFRDLDQALQSLDSRPLIRVQRALDGYKADVAASIKEHWSNHAARELGDVNDLLILADTLIGVEGIAEVSQELQLTLGELGRTSLPTRQSVELLAKAKKLLGQLESSLKPNEVRRFLSSVARGGASIESLTSDVKAWLADHDSLGRFKVVAGSPEGEPSD